MSRETYHPARYWERRYRSNRTSGAGSEGDAAQAKADFLNALMRDNGIDSVIDWGCGDGTVVGLLDLDDVIYTGVDVSLTVLRRNSKRWPQHGWFLQKGPGLEYLTLISSSKATKGLLATSLTRHYADLAISSDVLFHLVDPKHYHNHLKQLFNSARRHVAIHAPNGDDTRTANHVLWRQWLPDVSAYSQDWQLARGAEPEDCWWIFNRR